MPRRIAFDTIGPIALPISLKDGRVVRIKLFVYRFPTNKIYYLAELGDLKRTQTPLVRIQSACSFAHILNSRRCDDKAQFDNAMFRVANSRGGLIIYAWPHEGRGVGMWDHARVYMEQDKGKDTVSSYETLGLTIDGRDYDDVVEILQTRGINKMRLLTNNPAKLEALRKQGFQVQREPIIVKLDYHNKSQIEAKVRKLGHLIPISKQSG